MIPAPHLTHSQTDLLGQSMTSKLALKKVSVPHPHQRHHRRTHSPMSPTRKKTPPRQLPKSHVERHLNSSINEESLKKLIDPKFVTHAQAHAHVHDSADHGHGSSEGSPGLFLMEVDNPKVRHDLRSKKQAEEKNMSRQRGSRVIGYLEQRTHFEPDQVTTLYRL